MGRRDVSVTDEGSWAFNRLAGEYVFRPPYPAALIDRLTALAEGGPVVDLGAGIGHLAVPLAQRGLEIVAVEPARRMLDALLARAEGLPIQGIHRAAEATALEPNRFRLALIADAVHWLDPERAGEETARILTSDGAVAVVEVHPGENAFTRGLEALLSEHNPRRRRVETSGAVQQLLVLACGAKARRGEEALLDSHRFEDDQLEGLLRTFSHVSSRPPEALEALLRAARELAAREGGAVWERRLVLTWARRVDRDGRSAF